MKNFLYILVIAVLLPIGQALAQDSPTPAPAEVTVNEDAVQAKAVFDSFKSKLFELSKGTEIPKIVAGDVSITFVVPFSKTILAKESKLEVLGKNVRTIKFSRTAVSTKEWLTNEDIEIQLTENEVQGLIVKSYDYYPKLRIRLNENPKPRPLAHTEVMDIFNALKLQVMLESSCRSFYTADPKSSETEECLEVVLERLGVKEK